MTLVYSRHSRFPRHFKHNFILNYRGGGGGANGSSILIMVHVNGPATREDCLWCAFPGKTGGS